MLCPHYVGQIHNLFCFKFHLNVKVNGLHAQYYFIFRKQIKFSGEQN
jgi:hypothetical protein